MMYYSMYLGSDFSTESGFSIVFERQSRPPPVDVHFATHPQYTRNVPELRAACASYQAELCLFCSTGTAFGIIIVWPPSLDDVVHARSREALTDLG